MVLKIILAAVASCHFISISSVLWLLYCPNPLAVPVFIFVLIQLSSAFALCIFALSADGVIVYILWCLAAGSTQDSRLTTQVLALVIENASLFHTYSGREKPRDQGGKERGIATFRNWLAAIVALIVLSWFFGKFVISKVLIVPHSFFHISHISTCF